MVQFEGKGTQGRLAVCIMITASDTTPLRYPPLGIPQPINHTLGPTWPISNGDDFRYSYLSSERTGFPTVSEPMRRYCFNVTSATKRV